MATTNTINAALQLDVILPTLMRAFKQRMTPVLKFSTVFRDVALKGTNEINVPYYALDSTTPTDFSSSYAFSGSTSSTAKTITVNKRKYVPLSWTSDEERRQPLFNPVMLLTLKAEALADAVIEDIFSVVTAANFTNTAVTSAAAAMNFDKVLDAKKIADEAHWPTAGRALFLNTSHDTYLLRDTMLGGANYLSAGQAREGTVPRIAGFDYMAIPALPSNGTENIAGVATWPSCILTAFSPIEPTAAVRQLLTRYERITDSETNLTLEYRQWANAESDETREVLEVNYGYAAGEAAAIVRVVTA